MNTLALITYTVMLPFVATAPSAPAHALKGIGMPVDHAACADLATLAVSWSYDWGPTPDCGGVAMVWSEAIPTSAGPGEYLLVFNEPNNPAQANLTPAQAAAVATEIAERFPDRKLIIGGTYDGYSSTPLQRGVDWLSEFLSRYRGPIAGIHWHCYEWTAAECIRDGEAMLALARAHGIREVWVTEFAFVVGWNQRSEAQAWGEAATFIAWLGRHVDRYAWFSARQNGDEVWALPAGWRAPLLDAAGRLTYYGERY